MSRHRLFYIVSRLVIPLWLLGGAIVKLTERNPKLLPPPVLSVVQFFNGWVSVTPVVWLDVSMRAIVFAEFTLVAVMLCMPRFARSVAIAILSLFCIILLSLIVPAFVTSGFTGAWKGSCGCFGSGGPNPVVMLAIDFTLLVLAVISRRRPAHDAAESVWLGLPSAVTLACIGAAVVVMVPPRSDIAIIAPTPELVVPAPAVVTERNPPTVPQVVPSVVTPWPGMPASADPYYVPDFSTWRGSRLDSQAMARLMTQPPPATINTGTWFVMFYREDCDHCHDLLQSHFSGSLTTPTLTIAIPDTDPAASLEMPCSECQLRTLLKGPEYVLTTPVLLRVVDGVITDLVTDPEDRAALDRCLAGH